MTAKRARRLAVALLLLPLASCSRAPGRPAEGSEVQAPSEVTDSRVLYAANCAGCHGREGRGGAAIGLADPVYLAIADDAAIRGTIQGGVRGTPMPAFAQSAGGMLTEAQIDAITKGIRSWSRPEALSGAAPPARTARSVGDPRRGEGVFGIYCASCHGPGGEGGPHGSAIANDAFLALVSDQGLRTLVIAGRPDLGAPDWRANVPGRPMSDQEVTDVVTWLASRRVESPGQPYAGSAGAPPRSGEQNAPR
jgi:mono/diheme cytochrome c family protein